MLSTIWSFFRKLMVYVKKFFRKNFRPQSVIPNSQKSSSQPPENFKLEQVNQDITGNENTSIGTIIGTVIMDGTKIGLGYPQIEKVLGSNIPRSSRKVWGRGLLIDEIINQFKSTDRSNIFSLSASAGYGKTEVARQIAFSAIENNLFDDVLWVTAREAELYDGVMTSDRINQLNWDQFIYELSLQLDCTNEFNKVQKCILAKPYLIVLDNAETSDMESIISKSERMLDSSKLLLTTRRRVHQYVRDIECPGLTEKSSYNLLQHEALLNNVDAILNASEQELYQIYELSCGAPLALHFVVSRAGEDRELKMVLSSLDKAGKNVETFYEFTLKSGWDRITDCSKQILHYMGQLDASISFNELPETLGLSDSEVKETENELRRWFFILQVNDLNGNTGRYDLHPWMRRSLRSGLVGEWQESVETAKHIFRTKYGL